MNSRSVQAGAAAWPVEIRIVQAERRLEIDFDDGQTFSYPAELLRVESPSAEVQGHGPGQKQVIGGKRRVGIAAVSQIGNYAIRITFDDGHDSGIFGWPLLHRLGREQELVWLAYLDAVERRGLSRDP